MKAKKRHGELLVELFRACQQLSECAARERDLRNVFAHLGMPARSDVLPAPGDRALSGCTLLNSTRKRIRVGIGSRMIASHANRSAARRSTNWVTGIGVGCHTAANCAARRSAASLAPLIQIGGCGCWSGLGLTCISAKETNLPSNDTLPGA
jgi:hypothetical protein